MGVLQPLGGRVNGREHVLLGAWIPVTSPSSASRTAAIRGPDPGAGILGRESGVHDLLHVGVEVPKLYVPHLALPVEVLDA